MHRSAIDTRTIDPEKRRVKRIAQASIVSAMGIMDSTWWPDEQKDTLLHWSTRNALLAVEGNGLAVAPNPPAMRSKEFELIQMIRRNAHDDDVETEILTEPHHWIDKVGLTRVFDPKQMLSDSFMEVYLNVMDMLHGTMDLAFLFISFLDDKTGNQASDLTNRRVAALVRDDRSPLSRFLSSDESVLYALFNIHDCHWISMCWDRRGNEGGFVEIMDSYVELSTPTQLPKEFKWNERPEHLRNILEVFRQIGKLPEPKSVKMINVPQQPPENLSCGVYSLLNIRKRALGIDYISDDGETVDKFREYLLAEILTQRIPLY
jgi:hypothetical protein